MAVTIDQLNIELTADSQKASSSIDHLIAVLEKLEASVSSLGATMNNISASFSKFNSQANQTASNSTKTKNAFEELTDTIKSQEKDLNFIYPQHKLKF